MKGTTGKALLFASFLVVGVLGMARPAEAAWCRPNAGYGVSFYAPVPRFFHRPRVVFYRPHVRRYWETYRPYRTFRPWRRPFRW